MEKVFKKPSRLVVYIKDVAIITGRKTSAARNLYHAIKMHFSKSEDQCVTVEEFAQFMGIREELIYQVLSR